MSSNYIYPLAGKRVFVTGHRGMVGSALVRRLQAEDCEILAATRDELDLRRQADVERWMADRRPEALFIAAAKVGGISANQSQPADFLHQNLIIETNLIGAAYQTRVEKLVFLGSATVYPKQATQPIAETALLTGSLEPTHEAYAIAKIAGIKLCQAYRRQYGCDFVSAMPSNLYGPGDHFDTTNSHFVPALIRRFHEAKLEKRAEVVIWGSGTPRRELLYVEDCADALVHVLKFYSAEEQINVGSGEDSQIIDIARIVARVVGYDGKIVNDLSKPDGVARKLMSGDKLRALGWHPQTSLEEGIRTTYRWYLQTANQ